VRRAMVQGGASFPHYRRPVNAAAEQLQKVRYRDNASEPIVLGHQDATDRAASHQIGNLSDWGGRFDRDEVAYHQVAYRLALPYIRATWAGYVPIRQHTHKLRSLCHGEMMDSLTLHQLPCVLRGAGGQHGLNACCHHVKSPHDSPPDWTGSGRR